MIHSVALPIEETLIAEAIQKSHGTIQALRIPQGFQKSLAWELANLVRIAYGDYEKFDHQNDRDGLIQEGDTIWLPRGGDGGLINHFWLQPVDQDCAPGDEEAKNPDGGVPYKLSLPILLSISIFLRCPRSTALGLFCSANLPMVKTICI